MAIAIARSNRLPCFGISAGARFTVIRRVGKSKWELIIALRTHSFSFTDVSGSPTILNAGRPLDKWTSTEFAGASIPNLARLWVTASDITYLLVRVCRAG